MKGFLVAAGMGALLFGAWVVLLYRAERMVRTAGARLAALGCPRCGVAIGAPAAAAAEAAHAEAARRLREEARDRMLRLRVSPYRRFACPSCGAALRFDPFQRRRPLEVDGGGLVLASDGKDGH